MMTDPALHRALEDYIVYFERLSRRSVPLLDRVAYAGLHFIDPFHDVHGTDAVMRILYKMFDQAGRIKFTVTDAAWGRDGYTAYVRWTCVRGIKDKKPRPAVNGMSEILFGADGAVMSHLNYWDTGSQVLGRSPLTAWIWTGLKQKMAP